MLSLLQYLSSLSSLPSESLQLPVSKCEKFKQYMKTQQYRLTTIKALPVWITILQMLTHKGKIIQIYITLAIQMYGWKCDGTILSDLLCLL